MKQIHYARKKRQLKALTKELEQQLVQNIEGVSIRIEGLILKIKKLVQELTHVLSHSDLKKILGTVAIFVGISLTNPTKAQLFAPPVENPFGLVSVYKRAKPTFVDVDNDGDMDLFVGEYSYTPQYFENIGDSQNPQFAAPQTNPFGLVPTFDYHAFPTFADLDDDGDMDLLVGEYYWQTAAMEYFENTGSPFNPQFAEPQWDPFGIVSSIDDNNFPIFADLDGDNDQDLLLGGDWLGTLHFQENTGSSSNPIFAAPLENPFGLVTFESGYACPAFADLDGDGDMDLLAGEYDIFNAPAAMYYYKNIGTASDPQFATPQINPFGLTSTYENASPAFADLDGDGDMDLLVGEKDGSLEYFENIAVSNISKLNQLANLKLFPNPSTDILNIQTEGEIGKIEIFNLLGEDVISIQSHVNNISLHDLKPGIYNVKVTFENGMIETNQIQKL